MATDTLKFVNCKQTDRIASEQKFRVTFAQSSIEQFLFGDQIASIYRVLTQSVWCYVVSEPPVDNQPVLVADLRISQGTVGSSPPGTVADLANSLQDLTFFTAGYDVTRIERLPTDAPVLEQRSVVINQALSDQADSGVLSGLTAKISGAFGGVKNVVVAVAVIAGAIIVLYVLKSAKAAAS